MLAATRNVRCSKLCMMRSHMVTLLVLWPAILLDMSGVQVNIAFAESRLTPAWT